MIIVSIITGTLFTLGLWFSALTTSLIAVCWSILAYQKYKIEKSNEV